MWSSWTRHWFVSCLTFLMKDEACFLLVILKALNRPICYICLMIKYIFINVYVSFDTLYLGAAWVCFTWPRASFSYVNANVVLAFSDFAELVICGWRWVAPMMDWEDCKWDSSVQSFLVSITFIMLIAERWCSWSYMSRV